MADKAKQKPKGGKDVLSEAKGAASRAQDSLKDAQKLLQNGELTPDKLEKLMKDGQAQADQLQALAQKGLSVDAFKQVAGSQVDPKLMKTLEQAQKLSENGGGDLQSAAGLAASLGEQAGIGEQYKGLIEAFGNLDQNADVSEAGKIPGLVVDQETGTISVLGLLDLDAKNPISRLIASGAQAAYNTVILPFNARLYEHTYKWASGTANTFDLTKASNHRIGVAAALGSTGVITFWPLANTVIQLEKQGRKDTMALANRFAPLLDSYDASRSSRVAKLYQIRPETNEMIYNERRRQNIRKNLDRYRVGIQTLGQVPLYAASIIDGSEKLPEYRKQAEKEALFEATGAEGAEAAFWKALGEKADFIEKQSGGRIKGDKALELARERLDPSIGANAAKLKEGAQNGFIGEMWGKLREGGVTIAAPFAMNMVAQALFQQRLDEKGIQPVSAADMVFHLRTQLEDDPLQEKFTLPKDVTIEGSKATKNEIRLEEYVEQIFLQHERDSRGAEAGLPKRYEERLDKACKLIANALRENRLDGLALVRLVGERQIVRENGRLVAEEDMVQHEIARLEQEMQHLEYVDREKYFAESYFTPEELKASWDGMDDEERASFALIVPPQVLESVGVDPSELHQLRGERQAHFYEDLATISHNLLALGDDKLLNYGMTKEEAGLLRRLDETAQKHGPSGLSSGLEKNNISLATHAIANVIVSQQRHMGRVDPMAERHLT